MLTIARQINMMTKMQPNNIEQKNILIGCS